MNKPIAALLCLLGCHVAAKAQGPCDHVIEGQVLSLDSKEPLPFATVRIKDSMKGATTNETGHFVIKNICNGEVHLEASCQGYKTIIHHHDPYHPSPFIYLAPDEYELESVVIETKREKNSVNSLSLASKEIEALSSLGKSAGELATGLSGVSLLKTGQNVVKPIVHGLHSNRVLIINHGVRHAYQAWGREHAPEIDPSRVERVTVIKGASTIQYGPEALGGVILFDDQPPFFDQPVKAKAGIRYHANGRSYAGRLAVGHGAHRFAWEIMTYRAKQGDLRTADYSLTNTGKEEFGYGAHAKLHTPKIDLDLYISRFSQKLGILRASVTGSLSDLAQAIGSPVPKIKGTFSYEINNPRQETAHDLYKLKVDLFFGDHEIEAQYAYQRNLRKEFDIRRGTNNQLPQINLELNAHSLDTDWKYPSLPNMEGLLGFQFYYQDNNNIPGTNTISFIPNYNIANLGVFTIQEYAFKKAAIELGVRYDHQHISFRGRDSHNEVYRNELTYDNVTFTAGCIKELGGQLKLHTNVSSAWRAPKVGELYSFGKNQNRFEYGVWRYFIAPNNVPATTKVYDNTSKPVKSEKSVKWISSLTLTTTNFRIEAVPYINYIQHYFYIRPFGLVIDRRGAFPGYIYDQTDALLYGLDTDVTVNHPNRLSSQLKVSYLYAKDIANDQFFLEMPPLNARYTLDKKLENLSISLTSEWTASQWNAPAAIEPKRFLGQSADIDLSGTFDFIEPSKGFFLLHAALNYEKKPFSASLKFENLTNQSYRRYTDQLRYYADSMGFNASVALGYRLSK